MRSWKFSFNSCLFFKKPQLLFHANQLPHNSESSVFSWDFTVKFINISRKKKSNKMKYSYNQNYKQIEHPFPQRTRRAFSSCPNPSDFCALAIPSGSAIQVTTKLFTREKKCWTRVYYQCNHRFSKKYYGLSFIRLKYYMNFETQDIKFSIEDKEGEELL